MSGLFSAWRNWRELREILLDLRRQKADNAEQIRFIVRDSLGEALSALRLNDDRKAAQIWTRLRDQFPDEIGAAPLAPEILLKLGRFDEAEALMLKGRKRHPGNVHFARGLAAVSEARGDHDQAICRYAALRKRFPGAVEGYVMGALSLAAKNKLNEAEALAMEAMKRFPEEIGGFLEYARIAARRQNWLEALERWQNVQDGFGHRTFGYMGCAQTMILLGRYNEADAILADARIRFPTDSGFFAESARCAEARGDIPAAVSRWKSTVERFPLEAHCHSEAADAFERLGRPAEAEAALRGAADRFSTARWPILKLAEFLERRGDMSAAAEISETPREIFPAQDNFG